MKWLFAVLVALNIIVFGGMVASRVAEKQKTVVAPTVPMVSGRQELNTPVTVQNRTETADASAPDWVSGNVAASAPTVIADEAAEREKKAREEKLAREKKAREERAKREEAQLNKDAPAEAANQAGQCSATASVVMDEDDYHRIKGLLNKWPHAASRTVEKRNTPAKKAAAAPSKIYRVLLPSGGNAMAQMNNLAEKGFTGSIYNGEISVGVVRSKSAAQVLMSRLAGAGFGGAHVDEQQDRSPDNADRSLSVSRMQVLFMAVDDKDAKAIQAIVGNYGNLNRNRCR